MTRRARLTLCLVGLVALATPVAGADGQDQVGLFIGPNMGTPVSVTNVPARITGQFTVSFHGDAATGCAAAGLCAYSGTIVVRPRNASLNLATFRRHARLLRLANLSFDAGNTPYLTIAQVVRAGAGVCADGQSSGGTGLSLTAQIRRDGLTIRFLGADTSVLSTRCAGPLDRDVIAAAPHATIPLGRALRGQAALDLSGTRPFAAGGFAGKVSSTIRLRLGRSSTQRLSGGGFPSGVKTRRIRIVTQPLSIVRVAGRLTASVRGAEDPLVCRLLDTCGLTGTVSLTPRRGRVVAYLTATGPASRPYQDFLAALGLSRTGRSRGIQAATLAVWSGAGDFRATIAQGGTCTGSAPLTGVFIEMTGGAGRLTGPAGSAPWRTRCPGPMVGGQTRWLTAMSNLRTRETLTVRLRPVPGLQDDGYTISLHGQLTLTLRRGRISQSVRPQPVD